MSEQKPVRPMPQNVPGSAALGENGPTGKRADENSVRPFRHDPAGIKPTMRSALQSRIEPQSRRGRGRLTRETLNKLGKVLEAYFDDVRNQGVPDRFKDLLQQYDDRKDDHSGGNAREDRD